MAGTSHPHSTHNPTGNRQARGFAAHAAKEKLAPFAFARRAPGPQDVAMDVHYCGVCHSDVHQARAEWGDAIFPMVPGHEIVGKVTEVGAQVTKVRAGDWVGVGCFVDSCRRCKNCADGFEQFCQEGVVSTYNGREKGSNAPTYGGYSNHIVVKDHFVLRMPENLPADAAAPLLCAGITTYSPLKHWQAGPGKEVGVIGLGGLGHMAVKIARAMGARVTVLSRSPSKKDDALKMGAHDFIHTQAEKDRARAQNHFHLIINTVSAPTDWNESLGWLMRDGAMVMVGMSPEAVPVHASSVVMGRKSLSGSLVGGLAETQEMLDFCGKHNITCEIERIQLQDINVAYERMLKSDVRYRFVIDIGASLKAA